MNTNPIRSGWVVSGALAVAMLAAPWASADDDPLFDFWLDPLIFEMLFVDQDTNSSKFSEYRDMSGDALIRRLHLLGASEDGNRAFDLDVWNAGRTDARYTLRYGESGRYGVLLDYNVIPHLFGNDGRMLHSFAGGPGVLLISDTTQQTLQDTIDAQLAAMQPINYDFLGDQLQPFIDAANLVDPRLERRMARARVDIHKLRRLSWRIDARQETREGSRPYGATFGFNNAIELPEPIRYDTRSVDASGEWLGNRSGVRFGFNVSTFENKVDTLTYDNPWRVDDATQDRAYLAPSTASIDSPSRGRNVLAPDNQAGHLYVAGHARFGKSGWFNGKISLGKMEQDEPLVAHTINTAITPAAMVSDPPPFDASDPANLPTDRADTEVRVLHLTANAGTKLGRRGSVKFRARYYDYDNQSSRLSFPGYVRMDTVWEPIPRITVPYAFTRQKVGVEFGFDPSAKTHLAVGYDLLNWDREFREIRESDEDIYHVTVDSRASKRVTLRGRLEYGDRTTDEYMPEAQLFSLPDETEINNQPGLRKYDEAVRDYLEGRFSTFILVNDRVTLNLGASRRDEDYDRSEFGLVSDERTAFHGEVGFVPDERLSCFLFAHFSDRESFQRARQSGSTVSMDPLDDWELTLTEETLTLGLGLDARLADRWHLTLNGSRSDSDGDSNFFSPLGGAQTPDPAESFDEYDDNEWTVYTARLEYTANERMTAGLTVARDEFTTNRFQRDGLQPYLPGTLILDVQDGNYEADIVAVDLRIVF